jgi:hypothetical protein
VAHYAHGLDNQPRIQAALERHAHQAAVAAHPERHALAAAARTADTELTAAWRDLADIRRQHEMQLSRYGALGRADNPGARLARLESDLVETRNELGTVQQHIGHLTTDPAIRALPAGRLDHARDLWRAGYDARGEFERRGVALDAVRADLAARPGPDADRGRQRHVDLGRGIGR